MRVLRDMSLSAVSAGLVTVLVGFTSSAVIVFQAAQALGATPAQVGSWMLALCLGMGVTGIALSLYYRVPIALAWSTSGAAILTSAAGLSMAEAIGAFLVTGVLITLCGFTRWFERAIDRIPMSLAAGMLSGVLLRFGINAFSAGSTQLTLTLSVFFVYMLGRRLFPRYAVIVALCVGCAIAAHGGLLHLSTIHWEIARPVFVAPQFSVHALIGLALPLFVVTMASQNVPAVAVLRASGFKVSVSPLIGWTGIATVLLAPLGAYSLNLATITAAICIGREAHEDPAKRYVAAVFAGIFYIVVGLFGATVGAAFAAFPNELIQAIAGFALLGTIGNGLATALQNEAEREPALVTFLATASGFSAYGIGSAFWGLIAGVLSMALLRIRMRSSARVNQQVPVTSVSR